DTQRDLARSWNIVAEGRDMGIVVFPDAFIKFFVTAELEERAKRRFTELLERGEKPYYSVVLNEMRARDIRDESRKTAPLAPASDSIIIDTTHLTPKAAFNKMLELIEAKYVINGQIAIITQKDMQ
ncbi:MAG: d(CMP) kinase, partial [Desulfomonilaceae bacterium]